MDTPVEIPFLGDINRAALEKFLHVAERIQFKAGDTLIHEGDYARFLYLITRGRVALSMSNPPLGSMTIMTLEPGDWCSWSAIIEPRVETATARATEEGEALRVRGGTLMDLCHEDHELGYQLYHAIAIAIAQRLQNTRLQLMELSLPELA